MIYPFGMPPGWDEAEEQLSITQTPLIQERIAELRESIQEERDPVYDPLPWDKRAPVIPVNEVVVRTAEVKSPLAGVVERDKALAKGGTGMSLPEGIPLANILKGVAGFLPGGSVISGAIDIGSKLLGGLEGKSLFAAGSQNGARGAVRQWQANGAVFSKLANGQIEVVKRDGTIKRYRPYHSIVLGKKLKIGEISRAARRLRRLSETFSTVLNVTQPQRRIRRKK